LEAASTRGVLPLTRYLSDEEYLGLIRESDCVVLPYVRGTNSAVLSTVLATRKNMIVSDIPMFRSNPLIPPESFFACNDVESLVERLAHFSALGQHGQTLLTPEADERFARYEDGFAREVNAVLDPSSLR